MDDTAMPDPPGVTPKLITFLHRLEEAIVALLLLAMIILTCVQVGLRGFFSSGLDWADSLLRYLVIWGGLLAAGVATRRGNHITIDLASHLLPAGWLHRLRVIIDLFSAGVCGLLTRAGVIFVKNEATFGGSATLLGLTYWQLHLIFPLAFALMTCRFLTAATTAIRDRGVQPAGKKPPIRSSQWPC
jgi:TRAP-type C4-dicarboxylate transport system permease small subunit